MPYLLLILSILAAIHASLFGIWLIKNGNKPGAYATYGLAAFCIALSVYRLIAAK
ncbi:hypothetical protein [Sporomusa acidovorans]|uniref:Uncharacterized protein n=1 Tax=Sporomusa acidovorans (strain ATCC 49682 / DSM 3132 / Mol) TaxID=1123286 RepID=A0ABZ3J2G9_SPOA4|nr:hypothetical protein [Sporomusa acidovorans]OZC19937.1 hypothetical protein SPACI_23340 [Sporomusa acidovorans DSM 3132]SDD49461.1 hypothetical protein SAMN04488499_1001457 [Sporomusa acidovorans]